MVQYKDHCKVPILMSILIRVLKSVLTSIFRSTLISVLIMLISIRIFKCTYNTYKYVYLQVFDFKYAIYREKSLLLSTSFTKTVTTATSTTSFNCLDSHKTERKLIRFEF